MDRKRKQFIYKWLLYILVVILLGTLYLTRRVNTSGNNKMIFSVPEGKVVSSIELKSEENTILLTRKDGRWYVNGSENINKDAIANLLDVIYKAEVKSPVSHDLFEEISATEKPPAISVKVKGPAGLSKSFILYRTESNRFGNVVCAPRGSEYFIISLRGFDTNIGNIFTTDVDSWKPFVIFSHMPSEIVSLSVTRKGSLAGSFEISGSSEVGYRLVSNGTEVEADQEKILRYLSYFVYVPFTGIQQSAKGNRVVGPELFSIGITLVDGKRVAADFFEIINRVDSLSITDTDNIFGRFQGSDSFFVARYYDIDPLLKNVSYFLNGNN